MFKVAQVYTRMENLAGILQNKVRSRSKVSAVTEEVRLHPESSFQNEYNLIKLKQFNYPFRVYRPRITSCVLKKKGNPLIGLCYVALL